MTDMLFDRVRAWKQGLSDDIGGVAGAIYSGWNDGSTPPSDQAPADQVLAVASDQSAVLENTGSATDALSDRVLLPRTRPLWQSRAPQDDVAVPVAFATTTSSMTLGRIFLMPVRVVDDRTYEAIKVTATGNTMTSFFVGLYSVDTSTGLATKVDDLGNVKASINTSVQIQSFSLTASLPVNQGSVMYVAALSVGGTATNGYGLSSSAAVNLASTPTLYPQALGLQTIATTNTTLPSTIAYSALQVGPALFGALGYISSAPTPPNTTLSDTFNRADGSFGGLWVPRYNSGSATASVVSQEAKLTAGNAVAYTYATPTNTTDQQVETKIVGTGDVYDPLNGPDYIYGLILRASATTCVLARIKYGTPAGVLTTDNQGFQAQIKTFTSWTLNSDLDGGTNRATNGTGSSYPVGHPAPARFRFKAQGNTYTLYQQYGGLWNQIVQWVDSGALYTYTGNTAVGFAEAVTNARIDDWQGRDI